MRLAARRRVLPPRLPGGRGGCESRGRGNRDRRMAKTLGYDLCVNSALEHKRGAGVTQVVQSHVADICAVRDDGERLSEGLWLPG